MLFDIENDIMDFLNCEEVVEVFVDIEHYKEKGTNWSQIEIVFDAEINVLNKVAETIELLSFSDFMDIKTLIDFEIHKSSYDVILVIFLDYFKVDQIGLRDLIAHIVSEVE